MKNEIIKNGIEVTNENYNSQKALYFGIIVIMVLTLSIFICVAIRNSIVNDNLKYQIQQRDSIIYKQNAENNELTHDNLILSRK